QHALRRLVQQSPCIRHSHTFGCAVQKLCAEISFEFAHLPAQSRLSNRDSLRGSTEAASVNDGDKVAKGSKIHVFLLYIEMI
ncbi:MAG: hypothetical protein RLZZ296_2204, partial [Pseudomonadota bacterium]